MNSAEQKSRREAELAFARTAIGAAYYKMRNALGKAWMTDQRETSSMNAMTRDWNLEAHASAEFRRLLDELIAKAAAFDEIAEADRKANEDAQPE